MLDGVGDLTEAAKSIIEKPTFIADNVGEAGAALGDVEAGSAAGVFEGAGVLPALGGGLLAFGAGVGVGSVICHSIGIEGCFFYSSTGEKTAVRTEGGHVFDKGEWVFEAGAPVSGLESVSSYTWWWHFGSGGSHAWTVIAVVGAGTKAEAEGCYAYAAPPDMSKFVYTLEALGSCGEVPTKSVAVIGSTMKDRSLEHVTDAEAEALVEEGASEFEYEAPENWSEEAAARLEGHEGDAAARVGEKIASEIEGSGVSDPYATYVSVPSCSGEAWIECKADLEELELVPERSELSWETADVELEPDAVTELAPAPATEVETGSKVVVTTNPPEEGMPLLIPDPEAGETYDHYIERLAPGLEPSRQNVSDANADPSAGADAVLETDPSAGSRLPPSGGDVDVYTNPPYLAPGGGGGGCEASIGAVDFSPLNQPVGTRFPFGVIAFFVGWIEEWSGEGFEDPSFTFTVIPEGLFGAESAAEVTLDLETVEPAMELIRVAFLLVSFVGLLWFLGTAAMKVQGDAS